MCNLLSVQIAIKCNDLSAQIALLFSLSTYLFILVWLAILVG